MQSPPLPTAFLKAPIAHRAYHDRSAGRPENSREAVLAAVEAGYGIEIDLQPSRDGVPMVFHDYDMERLTGIAGEISSLDAATLSRIPLLGGQSGIPTFAEVLSQVAGRVPLLVEIKDQDRRMGPNLGALEQAAAEAVTGYEGPLAFMSFNPHSVARMAEYAPTVPRGITTCGYDTAHWDPLDPAYRAELRDISAFARTGSSFVSHEASDLGRTRITALKKQGYPILCWTIRSADDEARARQIADNVTFEHYASAIPA